MPRTIAPNQLDEVECPVCQWHGQVVACWCAAGDVVKCPICRNPVSFACDEPIVIGDGEADGLADTK